MIQISADYRKCHLWCKPFRRAAHTQIDARQCVAWLELRTVRGVVEACEGERERLARRRVHSS